MSNNDSEVLDALNDADDLVDVFVSVGQHAHAETVRRLIRVCDGLRAELTLAEDELLKNEQKDNNIRVVLMGADHSTTASEYLRELQEISKIIGWDE